MGRAPHVIIRFVKSPPLVIFVAMPSDIGPPATWVDSTEIKQLLYRRVAEQVKDEWGTDVDLRIEKDKFSQGPIHSLMFNEASAALVYIADLTGANPNVYLELGARWSLREVSNSPAAEVHLSQGGTDDRLLRSLAHQSL